MEKSRKRLKTELIVEQDTKDELSMIEKQFQDLEKKKQLLKLKSSISHSPSKKPEPEPKHVSDSDEESSTDEDDHIVIPPSTQPDSSSSSHAQPREKKTQVSVTELKALHSLLEDVKTVMAASDLHITFNKIINQVEHHHDLITKDLKRAAKNKKKPKPPQPKVESTSDEVQKYC